ncbi:MAG: MATE family efflux transporter [Treponema sp.]|nr:MATE family efflux transporter [Candidatus Treponema equifaecale]
MKSASNQIDMTTGPVFTKLVKFSVPLILSSILQLLFNAADVIVVGRYAGDDALAAVGSVAPLVNLLVNMFIGLSVGCNVVAANFFGGGRKEDVNRTVHTAMLLSVFGGIILTFIGVFLSTQILSLMGAPETVLPLSSIYLKVFFGGITATVVYNFGSALLRAKGDTKRPLYILFVAGVINVILNLIFVIAFEMSVAGVAFATVLSQCFSAVCVVTILLRESDDFKLNPKKLKIHWDIFTRILKIGIPAGLQGMIFSFSNVLIQSSVNSFGAVVVAGNSACQAIEGFIYTSMNGFAQGTLTFVSQNMGAHKIDRIRRVVKTSILCVTVIGLVLGFGAVFLGHSLFSIFTKQEDVIQAAISRIWVIGATYCLCGVMDCCANSIRGLGYSIAPMLITLFGACGLRILYLGTIFQIERFHTYQSIFVSYPLSWGITFVALMIFLLVSLKKLSTK